MESEDQDDGGLYATIATDNPAFVGVPNQQPAKSRATSSSGPPVDVPRHKIDRPETGRVGKPLPNQYELVDEVQPVHNMTDMDGFLYSNHTILEDKMNRKASRRVTQDGSINQNDCNTLYAGNSRWTNENLSTIVKDSNDCEYDHLRLQKA